MSKVDTAVQSLQSRADQAVAIQKALKKLDAQKAKYEKQLDFLLNGKSQKSKPRTKGAPKTASPRATSETGESLRLILERVLPGPNEDAIKKDEIQARCNKAGYKSKADDPKVIIGQTLGRMKEDGHAENAKWGAWRLTNEGVKAIKAEQVEAEAEKE